jgi:serine/threonine protein kinase
MTLEEFYKRFDFNSDASGSIIGRGGFGVVYKAFDKVRKRFVAIKRSEVGQFAKFELMREVEIANEIDPHPNILRYENVFRISDYLGTYDFAVMKYYPEGNLETVLRKNQLSEVEKKQILKGILKGLAHIHAIPIIHRDFKTANILMDKSPEGEWIPLICDFGQSRLVDTENSMINNNSQIALTPKYSAPEQLLDEKSLRPNADLWAFGVMTYQMVQGKLPFSVEDSTGEWGRSEKIRFLILQGELPKDIDSVPEPYQQIIRKCLIVDSEKRVKDASDLLKIIESQVKSVDSKSATKKEGDDKTTVISKSEPTFESSNTTVIVNEPIRKQEEVVLNQNINEETPKKSFNFWLLLPVAAAILIGLFFFLKTNENSQITDNLPKKPAQLQNDVETEPKNEDTKKEKNLTVPINEETIIDDKKNEIRKKSVEDTEFVKERVSSDTGTISITMNEDCTVSIDGKNYGRIRQAQSRSFTLSGVEGGNNSKVHIFKFTNNAGDEIVENLSVYAGKTFSKSLNF